MAITEREREKIELIDFSINRITGDYITRFMF